VTFLKVWCRRNRLALHGGRSDYLEALCHEHVRIGNEYFVDLTWGYPTFDNDLIEEPTATVKLPKKA